MKAARATTVGLLTARALLAALALLPVGCAELKPMLAKSDDLED